MPELQNQSNSETRVVSTVSPLVKFFASALYSGFFPFAPGTVGSLVGLLIYFLPSFEKLFTMIPILCAAFVLGAIAAGKMEAVYGPDPPQVTIDEVVGMWVSVIFLPKTILIAVLAFVLFRILDVIKPWPARFFDKRKGGWSIMLDDVMAGIYTNLLLQLGIFFFS